jgi:Zn finger protein HypA/HybF involved in hydrogenase expression
MAEERKDWSSQNKTMIDDNKVSMVICLHCLKRWISVRPVEVRLIDLVCPNCELPGAVIETGEEITQFMFEHEQVIERIQ